MQSLYERVVHSLIVESKVDTFARSMTWNLVRACKSTMDKVNKQGRIKMKYVQSWPDFLKRKDIYSTAVGKAARFKALGIGSADPGAPTSFTARLSIVLEPKLGEKDDVHMTGAWMPALDVLEVDVFILSTTGVMKPQHLSMIQQKAYEIFRHELEHSVQPDSKIMPAVLANQELMSAGGSLWKSPRALKNYLLSVGEKEAFVAGLYHAAKRTRRPFVKLLDDKLEMLMRSALKKGLEATPVRNILAQVRYEWLQFAKERFPKAQLE